MTIWTNKRMALSLGLSLLIHGLILFSFSAQPKGQASGSTPHTTLAVQLAPRPNPQPKAEESALPILAGTTTSTFKVQSSEPPIKETSHPESQPDAAVTANTNQLEPPAPTVAAASPAPKGSPTGIVIPTAFSLPWAPGLEVRAVNSSQNTAYRQMAQMHAQQQANQRTEQQAQTILRQLNASLSKPLTENGRDVAGSCELVESETDSNTRLVCTPVGLSALLRADEPGIVGAMLALRSTGKKVDRLSINFNAGQLTLGLLEGESKVHE